jgi:hypothetical protein
MEISASQIKVTLEKIYRSVASSTAIETDKSVQEIELQLRHNRALAESIGLASKPRGRFK